MTQVLFLAMTLKGAEGMWRSACKNLEVSLPQLLHTETCTVHRYLTMSERDCLVYCSCSWKCSNREDYYRMINNGICVVDQYSPLESALLATPKPKEEENGEMKRLEIKILFGGVQLKELSEDSLVEAILYCTEKQEKLKLFSNKSRKVSALMDEMETAISHLTMELDSRD